MQKWSVLTRRSYLVQIVWERGNKWESDLMTGGTIVELKWGVTPSRGENKAQDKSELKRQKEGPLGISNWDIVVRIRLTLRARKGLRHPTAHITPLKSIFHSLQHTSIPTHSILFVITVSTNPLWTIIISKICGAAQEIADKCFKFNVEFPGAIKVT